MPIVTATPRSQSNGDTVTQFVDSVGVTKTTYNFPTEQKSLKIKNLGLSNITLGCDGANYLIKPNQPQDIASTFTEFSVTSTSGIQSFEAIAIQKQATSTDKISISYKPLGRDKIVCVGDSIVEGNRNDTRNFPFWLKTITRSYVLNKGTSGNKLEDVQARLATDVIAFKPSVCVVLIGTNNTTTDTLSSYATKIADITTQLLDSNIIPIWCTLIPRSDNPSTMPMIRKVNYLLAAHCSERGIPLVDLYTTFANTDGTPKPGYLIADNLHPSVEGMRLIASKIAELLPSAPRPTVAYFAGDAENYAPNGFLQNDADSDGVGDVWTKTAGGGTPVTWRLENHPDFGRWQVVEKQETETRLSAGVNLQLTALTPGSTYRFSCDIDFSGDTVGTDIPGASAYISYYDASNAYIGGVVNILPSTPTNLINNTRFSLDNLTPTGTAKTVLTFQTLAKGHFTQKVGRVRVDEIPSL